MAAEAAPALSRGRLGCLAPAKVNLYLHLRGRRPDGYHLVDSVVVFPKIGDELSVAPADALSLEISGPFAAGLPTDQGNLILRAAATLARQNDSAAGAAIRLVKNLPVASGIGGGSSDAAAALRLLSGLWGVTLARELTLELGADVPVCCAAPRAMRMQGIGEQLSPAPPLPPFWLVLANPLVPTPTGAVFAGVRDRSPPPGPPAPEGGFSDLDAFVGWLALQRNDLQESAAAICPAVANVLSGLRDAGAPLARMSGSGATCFAIARSEAEAGAMSARLQSARPEWWIAAGAVTA